MTLRLGGGVFRCIWEGGLGRCVCVGGTRRCDWDSGLYRYVWDGELGRRVWVGGVCRCVKDDCYFVIPVDELWFLATIKGGSQHVLF